MAERDACNAFIFFFQLFNLQSVRDKNHIIVELRVEKH
jgi:hypothetical protein